jgi:hypothetical protein
MVCSADGYGSVRLPAKIPQITQQNKQQRHSARRVPRRLTLASLRVATARFSTLQDRVFGHEHAFCGSQEGTQECSIHPQHSAYDRELAWGTACFSWPLIPGLMQAAGSKPSHFSSHFEYNRSRETLANIVRELSGSDKLDSTGAHTRH